MDDAAVHRALAHPDRHRILMALRQQPQTVSGLARRLGVQKGSAAHHLAVLREAGLVETGETRTVRGGTETYWQWAVERIHWDDPAAGIAMMQAVAKEMASDDDALLHLRHVRLTDAQAAQLRAVLEAAAEAPSDDADGRPRGVLVALYDVPDVSS
ncbi:ArsR/SmtB family transcription factor [Jatrophihabitans fulvus]